MLDKMIIGTVQFGLDYGINADSAKKMPQKACDEIMDIARANGIKKLDTAEIYGDSIDKIGHYQRRNPPFEILSKFHIPENVYDTLTRSLTRLNVDSYHTILAHRSEHFFADSRVLSDLKRLKRERLVQHIGVSIYTNQEFEQAINNGFVDVIQFPFNLLDNLSQRGEMMRRAKSAGKILHARSAYLQGMFLKEFPLPPKLQPIEKYIEKLRILCTENNISMTSLCLEYAFQNSMIDNVVIGQHTASQLSDNICLIKNFKGGIYLTEVDDICVREPKLLSPRNWN
jgi:aryl-alcohol dehydrogenase-like predicted oxidoreductase